MGPKRETYDVIKLNTKSVSKRYISAVGVGLADLHEFVQTTHLVNKASCWTLAEVVPGKTVTKSYKGDHLAYVLPRIVWQSS